MRKKVLWLGFAVPGNVANELFSIDPSPAVQTHKFGWSFVRVLQYAYEDVFLASSCPVQNYPLVPRLFFFGGRLNVEGIKGVLLGFVNIIIFKHITRFYSCIFRVASFIVKEKINTIFIHGLHSPYLIFGLVTRLFGCRIIVVLTDPPGLPIATDGLFARFFKSLDRFFISKLLNHIDAVIALAPDLVRRYSPSKPALVFPGILERYLSSIHFYDDGAFENSGNRPFTIVYAGGLSAAYGVDRLIDAILSFGNDKLVHLKLFGRGDQVDRIRNLTVNHESISYGGFVDSSKLLPELRNADLLINPRPTHELFASQSFPSKLIEYMAIGRPVLTTRISSIPEELSPHFYFIDDESVQGIRFAIQKLMRLPVEMRKMKSENAMLYVKDNFSEAAIAKKIVAFINNLEFFDRKR